MVHIDGYFRCGACGFKSRRVTFGSWRFGIGQYVSYEVYRCSSCNDFTSISLVKSEEGSERLAKEYRRRFKKLVEGWDKKDLSLTYMKKEFHRVSEEISKKRGKKVVCKFCRSKDMKKVLMKFSIKKEVIVHDKQLCPKCGGKLFFEIRFCRKD